VVIKNVFAIGAERDGTHRHAQCVISILDSWRDARCRVPKFWDMPAHVLPIVSDKHGRSLCRVI